MAAQSSQTMTNACCEHCRTSSDLAHDEVPARDNQPANDNDGGWCMCEGAIFDVGSRQVLNDVVISSWELAIAGESLRPELVRLNGRFFAGDMLPSPGGGMVVRILNQSFLL